MIPDQIGVALREARQRAGLSQQAVSSSTNVSLRTIQRLEKGQVVPRRSTLDILAQFLNIELDELLIDDQNSASESGIKRINLLALLTTAVPPLNIIVPGIYVAVARLKLRGTVLGRALSFQILWSVLLLIMCFLSIAISHLTLDDAG